MAFALAFGAFAQDRSQIEQDAVLTRADQFFNAIDAAFAKHSAKKGPNWFNVRNEGKQFIVDDVTKFGVKSSKTAIKDQFDVLENDKKFNLNLSRYYIGTTAIPYDPLTATVSYYTTTYEVKSVASKGDANSVIRNRIEIKWQVNWKQYWDTKKNQWKKGAIRTDNKVKRSAVDIVSINTTQIPALTSEKEMMTGLIKAEIQRWYANLNSNFDYQKANLNKSKCVTPLKNVDASNIRVDESIITGAQQTVTVGSMPAINVMANNPYDYIPAQDQALYTDPQCSWTVSPTFKVKIDIDNQTAEIVDVNYNTKQLKPTVDPQKTKRLAEAKQVASDFFGKMSQYAQNPKDKEAKQLKKDIESMYAGKANKDKSVQFTLIKKDGSEDQKYVDKPTTLSSYLQHLPACEMNMRYGNARFGENTDEVIIPFTQTYKQNYPENYKGQKYADNTDKEVYLKYDNEKGAWLIQKITAQKGSTVLINNED